MARSSRPREGGGVVGVRAEACCDLAETRDAATGSADVEERGCSMTGLDAPTWDRRREWCGGGGPRVNRCGPPVAQGPVMRRPCQRVGHSGGEVPAFARQDGVN